MSKAYSAALSEHPIASQAVGEVVGEILDTLEAPVDLAALFVTPPHAGALEDIAAAVQSLLKPDVLIGCVAEAVIGGGREVEHGSAISLWAGKTGTAYPVHLQTPVAYGSAVTDVEGWPEDLPLVPEALIMIADPFSFATEHAFTKIESQFPGLPVVGGNASAAFAPGANRLLLNGEILNTGAVGVFLGPDARTNALVSQGCRPVGNPWSITRSDNNVIYELGGAPALERLFDVVRDTRSSGIEMVEVHLGRVIDEHRTEFGRGDFLVRNVVGADQTEGAVAINDSMPLGATVQFHTRDAATADEDMREMLTGRSADASLIFTCNGRGTRLFAEPNHDAALVADALDGCPSAGFFAAGEFGPVGDRNFVHGFTASLALFGSDDQSSSMK